MVEEKEVAALRRVGLTEYESRIYLALIKMGPKKASEVSFFGQVPRTKAYGALRGLESKGLLQIISGKPELYMSSSPSKSLMPLVTKLSNEVEDLEGIVQQLAVLYESSKYTKRYGMPKEAAEFWQMEGRQDIMRKLSQLFGEASKSINYTTGISGLIRAYKAHSEMLERVRRRGASVRVLSPISPENSAVAAELSEVVEVKRFDKPLGADLVSVDARELVVIEARPDDLRTDRGSDFAIWTTNKFFVELNERFFDHVWNTSSTMRLSHRKS